MRECVGEHLCMQIYRGRTLTACVGFFKVLCVCVCYKEEHSSSSSESISD